QPLAGNPGGNGTDVGTDAHVAGGTRRQPVLLFVPSIVQGLALLAPQYRRGRACSPRLMRGTQCRAGLRWRAITGASERSAMPQSIQSRAAPSGGAWLRQPATHAVLALGITQIIAWGTTLYALGVLGKPIAEDTGWSQSLVFGGLTIGLLVSAGVSTL